MNKIQVCGKLSDSSEDTRRFRQGDSISTSNFNLILEKIIHNTTVNPRGIIFNRSKQYMAYADDDVNAEGSRQKVIQ